MTQLQNLTANSGAITQIGENFDATSPAGMYGRRAPGVVGLTWAYYGGRGFGNTIADGTVALTASTTNYVVASRSTGVVSNSTSITNWNDTTNYYRLYLIVTGSATITTATDYREFTGGAAAGAGMTSPMTTLGDIIYGGSGGTPLRLGIGTNGYVLTVASGVPTWAAASTGGFANPMTTLGDLIVGGASGAAGRLASGTATYVLTSNGAGVAPTWQAASGGGGGGGLTNFSESLVTATPNSTVPVVVLAANNAATDVDIVLSPKGDGGLMLRVPNNSGSSPGDGGNKRGSGAIDLQFDLNSIATAVAGASRSALLGGAGNKIDPSATRSSIVGGFSNAVTAGLNGFIGGGSGNSNSANNTATLGGSGNTAGATGSVVLGGSGNSVTGATGIVGGQSCTVSADYSVCFGEYNSVTGSDSFAVGANHNVSGKYSFSSGNRNTVNADFSSAQGVQATTRGIIGVNVYSSNDSDNVGDRQLVEFLLGKRTTNDTPTKLTTNGYGASSNNQMVVSNDCTYRFEGSVVAGTYDGVDSASWKVLGLVRKNSGVVSFVGTPTVTPEFASAGLAATWAVALSIDSTNLAVAITVTGYVGNMMWNAEVRCNQVRGT